MTKPHDSDKDNDQQNTMDALEFEPTEEMFQADDGSWRWKAGTIDPLTGRERFGAQFVRGAPSPNPRGRPKLETDHNKYIDRYVLPELERRLIEILADPDIKHSDLINAYKALTDRRFGKPGQTIRSESNDDMPTYQPMVVSQRIIDKLNSDAESDDE